MAVTRERTGDRITQLYSFAIVSITKYYRELQSRTTETYFLTVLEARHPRSRCWPVWFLLWPADGPLLAVSPHGPSSVGTCAWCLSVCPKPSCRDQSHWVRSPRNGHILPHDHLFHGSILQIQSPREILGVRILPVSPSSPLSCPLIFCCDSLLAEPNWNLRPCVTGGLWGPRAGGEGWSMDPQGKRKTPREESSHHISRLHVHQNSSPTVTTLSCSKKAGFQGSNPRWF